MGQGPTLEGRSPAPLKAPERPKRGIPTSQKAQVKMQKQGLRFQGFINNWVAELNRTTEEDGLHRVLLEEDLGIDSAGGDALGRPRGLGQLQLGVGQVLLGDPRLKDTTHSCEHRGLHAQPFTGSRSHCIQRGTSAHKFTRTYRT